MKEEFDVIVIGSGPGGYVAAIRCAQLGMKTASVEKGPLGGTCLNVGCIPSKALLHSSSLFTNLVHHFPEHGITVENPRFDFDQIMGRKQKIVKGFNQGIAALFKKNRITHLSGVGKLTSPTTISVENQEYATKNIILATGSESISLPFLPIDEERVVTSTGALSLKKVPKKMIVIGAGVIGVELGSVYSRLGSEVTFLEFLPQICPTLDEDVSKAFQKILEKQGMRFHLETKVEDAQILENEIQLKTSKETFTADVVLCSIGRRPYTKDLGLENVKVDVNEKGMILVNNRFQTSVSNIYALGDVIDGPMLAHKASEEGIVVAEILSGQNPSLDYITIPNVIYTEPEVASVGLTEKEARTYGRAIRTGSFPFSINSRAKCTGEQEGFVKIIADEKTDNLLGVHIIGTHASEMISEAVVALQKKMTALELANTVHAHPTLSEAIKEAALATHQRAIHR